jgi:hypothetical protein
MYCKYTDVGSNETVAVIGDSHAASAYWGIAKLGHELGYNTVLLGQIIPAGEIWSRENEHYRPIIFDVLKKRKDIKKIFLCNYSTIVITGIHNYPEILNKARIERYRNNRTGYEPFKKDLQLCVDTLRTYGKEVFIISENPVLADDPRNYVYRPFKNMLQKTTPLMLYKDDVIKRQGKYLQVLSEIRNATVIETLKTMCPADTCLVYTENGLPMYFDSHHLSPIGSEFQAERILKPYLSRSKSE